MQHLRALGGLLLIGLSGCVLVFDTAPLDEGCGAGTKACGDTCVSAADPTWGCARTTCAPCVLSDTAAATCGANGDCAVASCAASYADCDGEARNGCEVNLDSDKDNCRRCGDSCDELYPAEPHVSATACAMRNCVVGKCEEGYLDCDHQIANGCEVNRMTDAAHCGTCATVCTAQQTCVDGECQ